ncbi:unnamed protein product [Parajaminaea phylloscopi]
MTSTEGNGSTSLASSSSSSSVGRRKEAAANRASMACLPCREAKHKCHGHPPAILLGTNNPGAATATPNTEAGTAGHEAEIPCARCASHSLRCIWLPKAKLGRPRKDTTSSSTATPSSTALWSDSMLVPGDADYSGSRAQRHPDFPANSMKSAATSPSLLALHPMASPPLPFSATPPQSGLLIGAPWPLQPERRYESPSTILSDSAGTTWNPAPAMLASPTQTDTFAPGLYPPTNQDEPVSRFRQGQPFAYDQSLWPQGPSGSALSPIISTYPTGPSSGARLLPTGMTTDVLRGSGHVPDLGISSSIDLRPGSFVRQGLSLYFTAASRCCLALIAPHEARLDAALSAWSDLLATMPSDLLPLEAKDLLTVVQAASLIGHRVQRILETHDAPSETEQTLVRDARASLDDMLRRDINGYLSTKSCRSTSYCLQALLLGCTLEYGNGDTSRAVSLLQRARALIDAVELRLFDNDGHSLLSKPASFRLSASLVADRHAQEARELADDLRRSFWEFCFTEVTLLMCTGGSSDDCLLSGRLAMQVQFPPSSNTVQQAGQDGFSLRYRAATLLIEALHRSFPFPLRPGRVSGLLTAIGDVIKQARMSFGSASTEGEIEIAVATYLMLNAACIELVRRTLFSASGSRLASGLGAPMAPAAGTAHAIGDMLSVGQAYVNATPSAVDGIGQLRFLDESIMSSLSPYLVDGAVQAMVEAANNIVQLIKARTDKEQAENRRGQQQDTRQREPSLGFSPFHAIAHLSAASGYVAALTIRLEGSAWVAGAAAHTSISPMVVDGALAASQWDLQLAAAAWPIASTIAEEIRRRWEPLSEHFARQGTADFYMPHKTEAIDGRGLASLDQQQQQPSHSGLWEV